MKKTNKWLKIKKELIKEFDEMGIRTCELKLDGRCTHSIYLTLAHTKKRRNITTEADLRRVVLACQHCHEIIEYKSQELFGMTMTEYLDQVIEKRNE